MTTAPLPAFVACDRLAVEIHPDRAALGRAAARAAADYLAGVIARWGEARVIFACAPSQNEFLTSLLDPNVCGVALDWRRITAFHMDDYVGLPGDHPQSFRHYLREHLLQHVPMGRFHPLPADETDLAAVCARYASLLAERPIDLICAGIGENGHIAFNDPPVADFDDAALVKVVTLDDACRRQQVNDGCFPTFAAVPTQALSLTVPVFRRALRLTIHVPGPRKAAAVRATLRDPITPACPASILRLHPAATLYVDAAAAALAGFDLPGR
jgi:glucosamine-6-phosphate deaminase